MVYDDTSKKWVPIKPGQQGFSRINMYHNTVSNTFRVVGVKLQDQQVRAGDQLHAHMLTYTHVCTHRKEVREKQGPDLESKDLNSDSDSIFSYSKVRHLEQIVFSELHFSHLSYRQESTPHCLIVRLE